jgi:Na+/H+ antiporter NhaD/arsenite permease-like protein
MASILVASIIVVITMLVLLWGKLHNTLAAILGALVIVIVGRFMGFYSEAQAFATIDLFTISLLIGMMILVALLEPTGFFQYLALMAGRLSRGKPIVLLVLLSLVSAVVSMFLANITTIILIAPVTILICEILGLESRPFLMSEAVFSNLGGVATMVGDPPNIIIASASGFVFNDFLIHSLPIVLLVCLVCFLLVRYLFRKELSETVDSQALSSVKPAEAIKDKRTVIKVLIVLMAAIIGFVLQNTLHVSPAFIAIVAAVIAILWVAPDIKKTLKELEWDVLIFFAALFILVGGLEASGALHELATFFLGIQSLPPVVIGLILLWVIAILSAIIDNIPITIAMVPIILELGAAGMDIQPLWWALVFGAGFGGNGTLIGATTNIVIASISEKTSTPITSRYWNKSGIPIMLVTCLAASIIYVIISLTIGW